MNAVRRSREIPALLLAALPVAFNLSSGSAEMRPNIVYILADDLGYGDLGCYGQTVIPTPNIDRLAAEGMRFTQHYAGSTVCAPSRSALLEGRHTGRCSVRGNQPPHLMDPERLTVAELLHQAGYRTGIVGKWGVGHPPPIDDPARHGFDHAFGYINMWHAHNCFPEFLYRNGERVDLEGNELDPAHPFPQLPEGSGVARAEARAVFAPDLIEQDALDFMRAGDGEPFFLYLALNLPHNNGEAARAFGDGCEVPDYGEFADRPWPQVERGFARMVQYVDVTVGRVMDRLHRLGLDENTLVLFTSDNGPYGGGGHDVEFFDSNGAFRGLKRDLYEGGIRVPLIAWWPGRVAAGSSSDLVCAMWDMLPTFAAIAGVEAPADIDGVSILPTLLGRSGQRQHDHLYWEFYEQGGKQAVRQGDWKAVRTHTRDEEPMKLEIFNLADDPGETRDLASMHPEIVRRLEQLMARAHVPLDVIDLFAP